MTLRIAVIYLGRRGAGGWIAYEVARCLPVWSRPFAAVSRQSEHLAAWRASGVDLIETDTFENAAGALLSLTARKPVRALAEEIRRHRPGALFFPMLHPWNPLLQEELREIPSVVMVHDPIPHPGLRDWMLAQIETRSIRMAGRCIVLSQALASALQKRGCPPERVDVVPHGELGLGLDPLPQPVRAPDAPPTLLFFGRITPYKGLEVLLPAFRRLQETLPAAELVIAGEGDLGPYLPLLRDVPHVRLENRWIPDVEAGALFAAADVVVLPYTSASQSGVVALAASFARPVVATTVGGIPEQIEDRVTGRLVRAGDPAVLAEALTDALANPAEARRWGRSLQEDFRARRSWPEIAAAIYRSCEQAQG